MYIQKSENTIFSSRIAALINNSVNFICTNYFFAKPDIILLIRLSRKRDITLYCNKSFERICKILVPDLFIKYDS